MADSKVSELTSATTVNGSDVLYLVQSNTSKKVTAGTLFENLGNVVLKGNVAFDTSVQLLASPGIIDLSKTVTHLSSDASGGTLVLPAGKQNQVKILTMIANSGGTMTISANIANNANVTFDGVGDTAVLLYTNNKWHVIGSSAGIATTVNSINGQTGVVTLNTGNVAESGNLYFTDARARGAISVTGSGGSYNSSTGVITITSGTGDVVQADLTTANVAEVTNLYFSNARVYSNVTQLGYITSSSLNGYATNAQLDSYATTANLDLKANITDLNTSVVAEGANLYFTAQRSIDSLAGNSVSTGELTIAGNIAFTACSQIISLANSSGDLNGYTTLGLIPDNSLIGNDQYLILDPTAPGHIHIRAGGAQDNSNSELIIGGENSYFKVGSGANPTVWVSSNNYTWWYNTDGSLTLPPSSSGYAQLKTGADANLYLGSSLNPVSIQGSDGTIITPGDVQATGNVTANYFIGDGSLITDVNSATVDITNTNGLTTTYYPTFVENRTSSQIVRADVNLSYRTDINTLNVDNTTINGNTITFANGATITGDPNNVNSLVIGVTDYPITLDGPAFFNKDVLFTEGIYETFASLANANAIVTHNCDDGHIFYHTTPTSNWTVNLTNLGLYGSDATTITLVINQGATPYYANVLQIGGSPQTIKWQGNTTPTGNANSIDVETFSIMRSGASYIVLGQLTTFG